MAVPIERNAPATLAEVNLAPRGAVYPSPGAWRDQLLYFLLPDRFSDGLEARRPRFDPAAPDAHRAPDTAAWMAAGKQFQGGTLRGIRSKLDYLQELGVTALWIGPIWRQRADLETYHGYGIQNFLDVDPRFGTRQDLRDLVDAAHAREMYVLLDIIYNHTGNNWFYDVQGEARETAPYRYAPRYPVHGWRSANGTSTFTIDDNEDAVLPVEFQNLDWYTRAGSISSWDPAAWEDPLHPDVEFRRGDFFDLKDLDLAHGEVLSALIRVYQYWIALSDCDGFRIDTVKHVPWEASRSFCGAIREFAESIGKDNFLLLGEVTGGAEMARDYLDIFGRNLDAVLDIGVSSQLIGSVVSGFAPPQTFFEQFQGHDALGSHRETGRYHVSILDDHDMVGRARARLAAGKSPELAARQVANAVALQLTTLGIPCIYYGTEQALDGSAARHDFAIEPQLRYEDRYIREVLFGGDFGAFGTAGCHFFNPDHPAYQHIAAVAALRNRDDRLGRILRRGRQYLRETRVFGDYALPGAGELVAWSRILHDGEVVVAMNSHAGEGRGAWITVDATLHAPGSTFQMLYNSAWPIDELQLAPLDEVVEVQNDGGRTVVRVDLPPASMAILG